MRLIEKIWFKQHPAQWLLLPLLLPLSWLFSLLSSIRRRAFHCGVLRSYSVKVPVVIVGNIGVGGNGKTPVVLYLVEQCLAKGLRVGVISRGYGGTAPHYPYLLSNTSSANEVGDEPLLIYQRHHIPVVVGSDRVASAQLLVEQGCQVIIADDGLQHYRIKRDVELIVIDNKRRFGNGFLLPAGPLREGQWRLQQADALIFNGQENEQNSPMIIPDTAQIQMDLTARYVVNIISKERMLIDDFFRQKSRQVNAIAGIGDPQRFFNTLLAQGFELIQTQGFIDHEKFTLEQLAYYSAELPLLMTEKDAVKCTRFANSHWWYLPVDAEFEQGKITPLLEKIFALAHKC